MTFTLSSWNFIFYFFLCGSTPWSRLAVALWQEGGHQAEKDKAELPFKFDMNSGCTLKEKNRVSRLHHAIILEQPGAWFKIKCSSVLIQWQQLVLIFSPNRHQCQTQRSGIRCRSHLQNCVSWHFYCILYHGNCCPWTLHLNMQAL